MERPVSTKAGWLQAGRTVLHSMPFSGLGSLDFAANLGSAERMRFGPPPHTRFSPAVISMSDRSLMH